MYVLIKQNIKLRIRLDKFEYRMKLSYIIFYAVTLIDFQLNNVQCVVIAGIFNKKK